MKINQLFKEKIDKTLLLELIKCFGLSSLNDQKTFCKYDLVQMQTVKKINEMILSLESVYLPCKAKIYLANICERRALTILKQVLRVHGYFLLSKEKNINNRKTIYYQLMCEKDRFQQPNMKQHCVTNVLQFN